MKKQDQYSFTRGIRLMTFALAVLFAVLAVSEEFKRQENFRRFQEQVAAQECDLSIFPSSLTRRPSSKLTKIERLEVVKILDRLFAVQYSFQKVIDYKSIREILTPWVISVFSKSDILANAP